MAHSPEFVALCETAKKHVREMSVSELNEKLKNLNFHLIDVREDEEFNACHLPGAHHLSRGIIEIYIHQLVANKNDEIVLYCGGGNRSALAAENLQKMGYTNVWSVAGGFKAWMSANYPITQ